MRTYQLISADSHLETPPEAWQPYLPARHHDRLPRLQPMPEGGEGWLVAGQALPVNGRSTGIAMFFRTTSDTEGALGFPRARFYTPEGQPAPGSGPPAQRLAEQDADGVDAEVLFPGLFIARMAEVTAREPEFHLALVQAYNTHLAEYCAAAPDRLIGSAIVPMTGVGDAVVELHRCHELGLRSVSFRQFPAGGGAPTAEDDRFWDAALGLRMALSPHGMFGDFTPPNLPARAAAQDLATAISRRTQGPLFSIARMIADGTFDRFPGLRIYAAEVNASWMPWALSRFDDNYDRVKDDFLALRMTPAEYLRTHFRFGFVQDPMALRVREHLPAEILLWGSDFPHVYETGPSAQAWLEVLFEGVPDDLRRRITLENALSHFRLDPHHALTETAPSFPAEPA